MSSNSTATPALATLRVGLGRSRDPRAIRTRQLIVDAVHTLARDHATIRTREIIATAGVNRTSFYSHLSGLDQLALHIFERDFARLTENGAQGTAPLALSEGAALGPFLRKVIDHYVENRALYAAVVTAPLSYEAIVAVTGIFTEHTPSAVNGVSAPPDASIRVVATYLATGINGVLNVCLRGGIEATPEQLSDQLIRLLPEWHSSRGERRQVGTATVVRLSAPTVGSTPLPKQRAHTTLGCTLLREAGCNSDLVCLSKEWKVHPSWWSYSNRLRLQTRRRVPASDRTDLSRATEPWSSPPGSGRMVLVPNHDETAHPRPTDATIRELYGHALSCAFDGCHEWLHKPGQGSARPVLNSRVAHIHARRRRGPRWLPGMSSEENRAPENLLLMCIPHSYEIDTDETPFPADLLRKWREAQLQEYLNVRQAWTLNDDQIAEIARLSFDSPTIAAPIITSIVEAAERAVLRASSTHSGPAAAAADWREVRARTRGMMFGRDSETGERLYAEPSRAERDHHGAVVLEQLEAVRAELGPLIEEVQAKTATARHTNPGTELWCDWVTRAAEELLAAASTWPWEPPYEDDNRLDEAATDLRAAATALAAALRGEAPDPVPVPPTPPGPNPAAAAFAAAGARHLGILERGRAYAYVDANPYNPDLRTEVAEAVGEVTLVPPVWSLTEYRLDIAAAVAASLTKNATDSQVIDVIKEDRTRRPLVAAAALLSELWRAMAGAGRDTLADQAREALLAELNANDWPTEDGWVENTINGAFMFQYWAHWRTPDEPKTALADALRAAPERLGDVVLGCAQWMEQRPSFDEPGPGSAVPTYRELPPWFPTDVVGATAATRHPDVTAATSNYDVGAHAKAPTFERLLAHILRLAAAANDPDAGA